MIVTGISELSGSRYRIEIDDQFAFVLYKGELCKYHIQKDQNLSEEIYEEITKKVIPLRAKKRCMSLLQSRAYTEAQLRDKLVQGFYSEEVIDEAVSYVSSFGYIDDLRYAEEYIMTQEASKSRRRIIMDLMGKGISRECIEKAWEKCESLEGFCDEEAQIRALVEKRKYDPETADLKDKQSLYAFLMRKGYSFEQIRRVLE